MKTFYFIRCYLTKGLVEAQAKEQPKDSRFIEISWGNGCWGCWAFVEPEKDGSFDKTKALQLAKALVEKRKKTTAKKMQKLEQQKVELEKELEAIA